MEHMLNQEALHYSQKRGELEVLLVVLLEAIKLVSEILTTQLNQKGAQDLLLNHLWSILQQLKLDGPSTKS